MSQSLADLFATGKQKKKKTDRSKDEKDVCNDPPPAYPAAESLSEGIPPDNGSVDD